MLLYKYKQKVNETKEVHDMLTVEKATEQEVILNNLQKSATRGVSAGEFREGLRKLKKLFKVGNAASVSVKQHSWVATSLIIRVKEETEAVQELIEAVSKLQWRNPKSDPYIDFEAGGNVRVQVQRRYFDEDEQEYYYA